MRFLFVIALVLPACAGYDFNLAEVDPSSDAGEDSSSDSLGEEAAVKEDTKTDAPVTDDTLPASESSTVDSFIAETSPVDVGIEVGKPCDFVESCMIKDGGGYPTDCIEVTNWWWTSHLASRDAFCRDIAHDRGIPYSGNWYSGDCKANKLATNCTVANSDATCADNMNICKP